MNILNTRITQLFGIKYPIILSGMRHLGRAELVAAVGNAGGLGFISAHSFTSTRALAHEIARAQSLCSGPIGVNITILPYLDVQPEAYAETVIDSGVRCVETSGGNPATLIKMFKAAGIRVLHKCTAVRFARKAEELGADAVSITGFEAAGHPGGDDVSNLVLIPAAAAQIRVPILANGGLADGRGLVAALALGADGVSMGTRFALTHESILAERVKRFYLDASERDTRMICRSLGDPTRVLMNRLTKEILELEKVGASGIEIMPLASSQRWVDAARADDPHDGAFAAGMAVGLIDDIPSCTDLVTKIVAQAELIVGQRLSPMFADTQRPDSA